jgi:hypothetical protein
MCPSLLTFLVLVMPADIALEWSAFSELRTLEGGVSMI